MKPRCGTLRWAAARRLAVTVCLLLLAACATPVPDGGSPQDIALAPGLHFRLPESPALDRRIEAAQFVTLRHGERILVFEGRISVAGDRFRMVALDPLGRRAFTINWTATEFAFEAAPWLPEELHAGNLLADLVLTYWPTGVISPLLKKSGAVLHSTPASRAIYSDGREVIRIEYSPSFDRAWNGNAKFRNLAWSYVIETRSTEISP